MDDLEQGSIAPPPAYDAAVAFSDQHLPTGGDEKKQRPFSDDADGPSSSQSLAGPSRLPTASPRPFAFTRPRPSPNSSSSGGGPLAALSSYLGFATVDDRTTLAVRTTVLALLRDVIANSSDASATVLVLQNCQDSCRERGIDFEALAQERYVEQVLPQSKAVRQTLTGAIPRNSQVYRGQGADLLGHHQAGSQTTWTIRGARLPHLLPVDVSPSVCLDASPRLGADRRLSSNQA